jgi:NADH-quinone oxidoreductase subunit J
MMLDIDFEAVRRGFIRNFAAGIGVALVMLAELIMVINISINLTSPKASAFSPIPAEISNTKALGGVLYTDYIYPFQVSGLILLVAMIGAIVLCLRVRTGVRKQSISKQIKRTRSEGVELVKVQSKKGV